MNIEKTDFTEAVITLPERQLAKAKVCAVVKFGLGALSSFMLVGAAINIAGRGVTGFEKRFQYNPGREMGEGVKKFGENVFMCGAVPIYATVYVLPIKVAENAPKVFRYLADKIFDVATFIFENVIAPIWSKCLYPVLKAIGRGLCFIGRKISAGLEAICHAVSSLMRGVFDTILTPLWRNFICPVLETIGRGLRFVGRHLCDFFSNIADKIQQATQWIFNHILCPVGRSIRFVCTQIGNVICKIVRGAAEAVQWICQKVKLYLWDKIVYPLLEMGYRGLSFVVTKLGQGLKAICSVIQRAASFVFEYGVVPAWNVIKAGGTAIGNFLSAYVITPLSSGLRTLANLVDYMFRAIYVNAVLPCGMFMGSCYNAVIHKVAEFGVEMINGFSATWNSVTGMFG